MGHEEVGGILDMLFETHSEMHSEFVPQNWYRSLQISPSGQQPSGCYEALLLLQFPQRIELLPVKHNNLFFFIQQLAR